MEGEAAQEERRYAPDGGYYTYQEFYDFYGGEDEWYAAGAQNSGGAYQPDGADEEDVWGQQQQQQQHVEEARAEQEREQEEEDDNNDDDANAAEQTANNDDDGEEGGGHESFSNRWAQMDWADAYNETHPDGGGEEGQGDEVESIEYPSSLDSEDQGELDEWADDFWPLVEVFVVLDGVCDYVANYDPEKDPVFLDEEASRGFRPLLGVTYKEKFALAAFYRSMNGPEWDRKRGWPAWEDPRSDPLADDWFGLQIDPKLRATMGICLNKNLLGGTLPEGEMGKLTRLTTITINRNGLKGPFPRAVLECPTLRSLDLHDNEFEGELPWGTEGLVRLAYLNFFYVHKNKFVGRIDPIFKMRRLIAVDVSENMFQWSIPDHVRKCAHLQRLVLSHNSFLGPIPEDIGRCRRLRDLRLDGNNLTGELPKEIWGGRLKRLEVLHLDNNEFEGELPGNAFEKMTRLQRLWLAGNRFRGRVPWTIGGLRRLKSLALQNNRLTGFVPPEWGQLTSLEFLRCDHNEFLGEIPRTLAGLTGLRELDLGSGEFGDNAQVENLPVDLDTLARWRTEPEPERQEDMSWDEFKQLGVKRMQELKDTVGKAQTEIFHHKERRAMRWTETKKRAMKFDNRAEDVARRAAREPAPGTFKSKRQAAREKEDAERAAAAAAAAAAERGDEEYGWGEEDVSVSSAEEQGETSERDEEPGIDEDDGRGTSVVRKEEVKGGEDIEAQEDAGADDANEAQKEEGNGSDRPEGVPPIDVQKVAEMETA